MRHYKVEYDLSYVSGLYKGRPVRVYIPVDLIKKVGMEAAFEQSTGVSRDKIIYYSEGWTYDELGNRCP